MSHRYILDGHTPVVADDLIEWGTWFQNADVNRRVAKTVIGDVTISTVFLAIDHNFDGGPPILFETMVFGGDMDETQEQYHTWEEAEAGHAAMVICVTAAMEPR